MAGARFAEGRRAWGVCQRCGLRDYLRNLVEDGQSPGLLVHQGCYEPKHPQEKALRVDDPQALFRPSPDPSAAESRTISNTLFENLSDLGATFGAGSPHEG